MVDTISITCARIRHRYFVSNFLGSLQMFPAFDFSHLIIVNQGKIISAMQTTEPDILSEIIITDSLLILEKIVAVDDRDELKKQYHYFPIYVLVGNLWTHHYPQIREGLVSRLIEIANNILPEMQFDVQFRVLIFAHFLGLVANTISGKKALEILDHYLEYLGQNSIEDETYFSYENILPYILVAVRAGEEKEALLSKHLPKIDHLNILLEMFAYFDEQGDVNAANIVMSVLMEKAATTDVSYPPRPDWNSNKGM